ncbi:hypothetical protein [Prosthecobacter sp.]|uniref:hypothetical protein n=1 Tax=Prosthecobacter sp. TaxID=1965333 RepID=UPI001D2327CB|nr:hypothetical protein [Prosthecobacter sp.]MCB1277605.1 hypothetical protein [Prosthecobacter sp.]
MELRAAFLLPGNLMAIVLTCTAATAATPLKKEAAPRYSDGFVSLPGPLGLMEPSTLLPPPDDGTTFVTLSKSSRRAANPDVDLTSEPRRWQSAASSSGFQPYTWGLAGDINANVALGLQSTLFYTDNIDFLTSNRKKSETVFEISPVIKLDLGDPQGWISGPNSGRSQYYTSLLYVPTFYYHLGEEVDDYAQHFLCETGRVNEVSRSVLRLEYDERILASSENTSPEMNYTLLDASALQEYKITPRTTLRGKGTYRKLTVAQATSNRSEWIGDLGLNWELSPKTKLGIGSEFGSIIYEQRALGSQNYQQALILIDWRPTTKFGFNTRTGIEWREFQRSPPQSMKTSLVTMSSVYWQVSEKTRINTSLRVANTPSVLAQGALFRQIRFGPDISHDFSPHFYSTAAVQVIRRLYDTGRRDWEPMLRLALGYRGEIDREYNRTNIELFYQWHQRTRSDVQGADVNRSQVGVQLTRYF